MGALVATLALQILGWRLTTNWLWGASALHAWPAPGAAALVTVALIGFVPPLARGVSAWLETLGRTWERAGVRGDLVAAGLFGVLLFSLRDTLRYVGDFDLRFNTLGLPTVTTGPLRHAYPLDLLVNVTLPRALLGSGAASGLQLVGAVVGTCFAFVVFRFLRSAGARGAALPAGALVVMGGALSNHFAGYDKFGPLLLGLAIAGLGAVELAREGRGFGRLGIGATIAILSHRSGFLALPAALWTAARAWPRAEASARARIWLAVLAPLLAAAAMLPRTVDTFLHVDRVAHLRRAAGAAPLRWIAISDAANVLLFLVPLWLAAAACAAGARSGVSSTPHEPVPAPRFSLAWTAALAMAPFAALLLLVHPAGGWSRDWDDGTGAGVVAALASAYALVGAWRAPGVSRTLAPAVTLALAVSVALWGIHASSSMGIARLVELVRARPQMSDASLTATLDFFGARTLGSGHPEWAASLFERAIAVGGANPRLLYQAGEAYLAAGDAGRARGAFERAAALNPAYTDPWLGLARVALAEGDTLRVAAMLDSAGARVPDDAVSRRLARDRWLRELSRDQPSPGAVPSSP